ncbi:MAG TPA: response regulator [Oscillatoriaceae cyanobacterium M33_DOE_052]|nr:response regulator [Oscillatoriaceae cyanobacterium M33_DOE_052]
MAKILVIDDDITIQLVLQHLLQEEGHEVVIAREGKDGIRKAREWHPDGIICDWMMPSLDGLEVCRQVKAIPDLATTFFILLTAREEVDDLVKGLDAGADEFLSKPVEAEKLLARMRAGLRSRTLTQQLSQKSALLAALVEVQGCLLADNSTNGCYAQVISTLGRALDASHAYFWEASPDSPNLNRMRVDWFPKQYRHNARLGVQSPHSSYPPASWLQLLAKGQVIHTTAANLPASERQILEDLDIQTLVLFPVTVNGKYCGFIGCENHSRARLWDDSEMDLLRATVSAISLHLERSAAEGEKARSLAALQESEARYRAIVEDQTELICRFAPDGTITFVNDAYCRYFGISRDMARMGSLVPIIPDLTRDFYTHPVVTREHSLILPNGEVRIHQWTDRALFDDQNRLLGFQAVGQDITDRKRAEEEAIKALEKEKELLELKSRFVSMVSHEFRTPLTTILSAADLLEYYIDTWTATKNLEYIQRIQTAAVNMTNLLEDVLFIGRSEANKILFNPKPIDLSEFCQKILAEIQACLATNHLITFTEHFVNFELIHHENRNDLPKSQQPVLAFMDEKLLQQIIGNLVSNSLKYSPIDGRVEFHLIWGKSEVKIAVKDNGIGIPTEELPHLFESFYRAKNTADIPGTGLGLAIVKRSVDVHGGEISVESELGIGTTFTVTLPLISLSS